MTIGLCDWITGRLDHGKTLRLDDRVNGRPQDQTIGQLDDVETGRLYDFMDGRRGDQTTIRLDEQTIKRPDTCMTTRL